MTALEQRPASPTPAAPPLPSRAASASTRGWYVDPAGCHEYRYWDGLRWTPGVADKGFVREDPLPDRPCAPPTDQRARLPLRTAAIGLAGLALGAVAAAAIALAFHRWAPAQHALGLGLSQAALWTGMLGAVVLVSRRYGSGSVRRDYGFRIRAVDAGWGALLGLVARVLTAVIVVVLVLATGRHLTHGSGISSSGGGLLATDTNLLVLYCLLLVVGAPLVEELFFRGLMLRSLQLRLPAPVAVVIQALLFSACHVLTATGIGLVTELLSTLMFGLMAGAVVVRFRRLGPTIVGHALFNAVAAAALIAIAT